MEKFTGYNLRLKRFKDGGFRIEIDASENEWKNLMDMNDPKNDGVIFKITIVPDVDISN